MSFAIPRGSVFGIIGRSGAGKSTLLRAINMLERPSGGRVLVDGIDVGGLGEEDLVRLRRRVPLLPRQLEGSRLCRRRCLTAICALSAKR